MDIESFENRTFSWPISVEPEKSASEDEIFDPASTWVWQGHAIFG